MGAPHDSAGGTDARSVRPRRSPGRILVGLASGVVLALGLVALTSFSPLPSASAPQAAPPRAVAVTPTRVPTSTPTVTPTPASTPRATPTPTAVTPKLAPTAASAATPTPTPLPTWQPPRNPAKVLSIRETLHGQPVGILVPDRPNGVLVIAVHGHRETVNSWLAEARQATVRSALLGSGYSLAASDGAGEGWGNAKSVAAYTDLYAWAQKSAPFTRVVLIGESMGGLASLQLATRLPNVKAWVGIYPVCNLSTMTVRFADIALAWPGGTTGRLSPVNLSKTRGLRMIFFASPGDTIVPKSTNTDLCAARATAAGANVRVVQVRGEHGDVSAFQPALVVSFLNTATGHQPRS